MPTHTEKPGDLLTDDDGNLFFVVDHVPVDRDHPLYTAPCVVDAEGDGWRRDSLDPSARRLIVIDPEDREQVERLTGALVYSGAGKNDDNHWREVQAALREFANPTPPRPEEPTGLGAVVEDAEGVRWVRNPDHGVICKWRRRASAVHDHAARRADACLPPALEPLARPALAHDGSAGRAARPAGG